MYLRRAAPWRGALSRPQLHHRRPPCGPFVRRRDQLGIGIVERGFPEHNALVRLRTTSSPRRTARSPYGCSPTTSSPPMQIWAVPLFDSAPVARKGINGSFADAMRGQPQADRLSANLGAADRPRIHAGRHWACVIARETWSYCFAIIAAVSFGPSWRWLKLYFLHSSRKPGSAAAFRIASERTLTTS